MTTRAESDARVATGMTLSELIEKLDSISVTGDTAVDVTGVAIDSRSVTPGVVFVAIRGTAADGHAFVPDAVARGAVAVVAEEPVDAGGAVRIVVENAARAAAVLAAHFQGDPARRLALCGVTGTNGKTSVTHLIRAIMNESGRGRMGIVGTLGYGVEALAYASHTTPDAIVLHQLLREMLDQGCFGVVMEVSSHAVRQHRTWGLDFEVGVLTNVTHDHLDYHKTMEDYRAAKAEFCHSLVAPAREKPPGTLVYWRDDAVAQTIGSGFPGRKVTVGASDAADARVVSADATLEGTDLRLRLQDGSDVRARMRLLGTFVPTNAAAAAAAAVELGADAAAVRRGLEAIDRIPGRFEALGGGGRPTVIVDYSHTPDAMERVLRTCRDLGPERLTTVFGCGGDRDRSKRPLMGKVAQALSDEVFITMDNPRSEALDRIIEDILAGTDPASSKIVVERDRATAVHRAVASSGARDVVALLGKGHETYQIVGSERRPFSDREQAEEALAQWRPR